jgi:hypothetical protein
MLAYLTAGLPLCQESTFRLVCQMAIHLSGQVTARIHFKLKPLYPVNNIPHKYLDFGQNKWVIEH